MPESEGNDNQGTDSTQKEQPEAQSTSGTSEQWVDSTPNLEGDAKDLKDGQLTVVESVTEKADNGGDIIVSPGSRTAHPGMGEFFRQRSESNPDLYRKSGINDFCPLLKG